MTATGQRPLRKAQPLPSTSGRKQQPLRKAQPVPSISAHTPITRSSTDSVHVVHGPKWGDFPLSGQSVLKAKEELGVVFDIPYFAEAFVNFKPVLVDHVLRDGDRLDFEQMFFYKGAGKRKQKLEKVEAKALLFAYPELFRMAQEIKQEAKEAGLDIEKGIDMMAARVALWCKERFGPFPKTVVATLNETMKHLAKLADQGTRLIDGELPKNPGRKNTTWDIADFAETCRQKRVRPTWKEIAEEWTKKNPNRPMNFRKVRDAWRRRYGDKVDHLLIGSNR